MDPTVYAARFKTSASSVLPFTIKAKTPASASFSSTWSPNMKLAPQCVVNKPFNPEILSSKKEEKIQTKQQPTNDEKIEKVEKIEQQQQQQQETQNQKSQEKTSSSQDLLTELPTTPLSTPNTHVVHSEIEIENVLTPPLTPIINNNGCVVMNVHDSSLPSKAVQEILLRESCCLETPLKKRPIPQSTTTTATTTIGSTIGSATGSATGSAIGSATGSSTTITPVMQMLIDMPDTSSSEDENFDDTSSSSSSEGSETEDSVQQPQQVARKCPKFLSIQKEVLLCIY